MSAFRLIVFLELSVGLILPAFAQKKGIIADATSHVPLPYVNIYSKSNPAAGTYSDVNGQFTIPSKIQADTLFFSLLGYRVLQLVMPYKGLPDTLFLYEEPLQLATVLVKPAKKRMIRMGPSSSAGNLSLGSNLTSWHIELAALFTPKPDIPLYVESIEIYLLLHKKSSEDGYVRVNLYSVGDRQFPAAPLINRSFLVKVNAKDRRGKWHKVDVSDLMLKIPEKGLFVGVEFLPVSGLSPTSRNTSLRFGKTYPLRAVERIGGDEWKNSMVQKYKSSYSPLIRLTLSN
jgi:hypothetical protein